MYHIQNTILVIDHTRQAQPVSTPHFVKNRELEGECLRYDDSYSSSTSLVMHPSPPAVQEHALWYKGILGTLVLQN